MRLWHFWAVDKETLIKSRGFVDKETVDKESGKCVDKESGEMTFDKETLIKRREAKNRGNKVLYCPHFGHRGQ